jgi:hypothetical protein
MTLSPKQEISVQVMASAVQDPNTGYYTYSYTLISNPSSDNDVDFFAVAPLQAPLSIQSPPHWSAYRYFHQGSDSAIAWRVTEVGTLPPGYVDTGNIPPSQFDVEPGQSLSGFAFVTPIPPLMNGATFIAQGFDTLPGNAESWGDDYPFPDMFEEGVTGQTLGMASAVGVDPTSNAGGSGLQAAHPNPSKGSVTISYSLAKDARVQLGIYDVSGRRILNLVDATRPAGMHSASWSARDEQGKPVVPGVYFYKLFIDGKPAGERRVVLVQGKTP